MDYAAEKQSFAWPEQKKFNFARDVIDVRAAEIPDVTALHWLGVDASEEKISFSDMADRSKQAANVLQAAGIKRGDSVIVVVSKIPAWWELFLGCLRIGAIVSPATVTLSGRDLDYRIKTAKASAVVIESNLLEKLTSSEELPNVGVKIVVGEDTPGWHHYYGLKNTASKNHDCVDSAADEDAICYFTSGTTGYAKMTIHTHASSGVGHEITGKYWLNLKQGDLSWCITDTGWAKIGYSALFGPWRMGSTVFVVEEPVFDPQHALSILQDFPINVFCAPPTVYRILVQNNLSGLKNEHLRDAVSAGEPLNAEVINTWKEATDISIREGYGQTETVIICASFPGVEIRPGSMGKPSPGIDLEVVDDDGELVEAGLEGNIAVRVKPHRPLGLFKEYRDNPEKTAEAFQGDWYYTGDRAYKDEDGYFWFVSRSDDVIISSGYRIGPFEVESALQEHPAVLENAVVSSPDDTRGEVVKAFVILAPGHDPSEELTNTLQDFVKSITAPYKYPRRIEYVTELPKTISGKIRRVELREKEWRK